MAYVAPTTKTGVYVPDQTEINQLFDNIRALKDSAPSYARIVSRTVSNLSDATWTTLQLDELEIDVDGIVSSFSTASDTFALAVGDYRMNVVGSWYGGRSNVDGFLSLYSTTNTTVVGRTTAVNMAIRTTGQRMMYDYYGMFDHTVVSTETFSLRTYVDLSSFEASQTGYAYEPFDWRGEPKGLFYNAIEIWKVG